MIYPINRLILIFLLVLSNSVFAQNQPITVSLIQLISNPEKYSGLLIRVSGFLHFRFEESALYLSKDHADHLMTREAIWVNYAPSPRVQPSENSLPDFDSSWVLLEGIFNYENTDGHGHFSLFTAEINDVTRIMQLTNYSN